jgi:LPS export ABC transporter permease LptG
MGQAVAIGCSDLKRLAFRNGRWVVAAVFLLLGVLLCGWVLPLEREMVRDHLRGFPDADPFMHGLRLWVLGGMCFLPFGAALGYAMSGIISRWLVREFLRAMLVCFGGILLICFLIDFANQAPRFGEADSMGAAAWYFYSRLAPSILCLLLPFGILFATVYCVVRVSRTREVVAAVQSGRSLWRVMMPVYASGLWATLLFLGSNFHWAPTAEGMRWAYMDEALGRTGTLMGHTVCYHGKGRRMWMVTQVPRGYAKGVPLRGVEVTSLNKDGSLASRLYADLAMWVEAERAWKFEGVVLTDHRKNEAPVFVSPPEPYVRRTWQETPRQIVKVGLDVRHVGLPDLTSMLRSVPGGDWMEGDYPRYATQWHYRLALPVTCLMYGLFAVPMALFVTRRAHGGSVAGIILLAIVSVLFSSVGLALGESGHVSPMLAAWSPVCFFALLGIWMMCRRCAGRPLWPVFG